VNRRRVLTFGAMVVLPLLAVGAACTFPEVGFGTSADGGGVSDGKTGDPDVRTEAGADQPDGSSDASDASDSGNTQRNDANAPIADASVCATRTKCDCDLDNYRDEACALDAGAGGFDASLLKGDCDDLDSLRNPGAGYRDEAPNPDGFPPPGDWNCSGAIEYKPDRGVTKCTRTVVVQGVSVNCSGPTDPFFFMEPKCGDVADLYTCPTKNLAPFSEACNPQPFGSTLKQTCK